MNTLYAKDLDESCRCALMADTPFFMQNPSRRYLIRYPYECEEWKGRPEGLTQIVVARIDQPIEEVIRANPKGGTTTIRRRTFLILQPSRELTLAQDNDEAIETFIQFIESSQTPTSMERH